MGRAVKATHMLSAKKLITDFTKEDVNVQALGLSQHIGMIITSTESSAGKLLFFHVQLSVL